jgi:hypothetical protein
LAVVTPDEHGPGADRHQEHPGEQVRYEGAVDGDPREPVDASGGDQRAGDDHGSRPDAGQQLGGDAGGDHGREGQWQVGDTGADRRVAQDALHIEGEEEEDRQEARKRGELSGIGEPQPVDAEDRQRRERVAVARLVDYERRQQRKRSGELADRGGVAPADRRCLHERVDQQQHPAGGQDGAEEVEVVHRSDCCHGEDPHHYLLERLTFVILTKLHR